MTPDEYRAEEGWKDWKRQEARIAELERLVRRDARIEQVIEAREKKARAEERERVLIAGEHAWIDGKAYVLTAAQQPISPDARALGDE